MRYRCIDCKQLVADDSCIVLNGTKNNEILFVCRACYDKPKAPQTDKKETVNSKLGGLFEVLNGGKE